MDQMDFKVNSKYLAHDFPREFDAHIYFTNTGIDKARELRDQIKTHFQKERFFVGDVIPVPMGPHPLPMFEANFPKELFSEVVLWLMNKRGEFSVLIHPLSGDDYFDHTQGAMWLGQSLSLDLTKF